MVSVGHRGVASQRLLQEGETLIAVHDLGVPPTRRCRVRTRRRALGTTDRRRGQRRTPVLELGELHDDHVPEDEGDHPCEHREVDPALDQHATGQQQVTVG